MLCKNCGYEMDDDSIFCQSCGAVVENTAGSSRMCANCGSLLDDDAVFCNECGTPVGAAQIAAEKLKCSNCGSELDDDAVFCSICGTTVAANNDTAFEQPNVLRCSNCGSELDDDAAFCNICGAITGRNDYSDIAPTPAPAPDPIPQINAVPTVKAVAVKTKFCVKCGSVMENGSEFCTNCGARNDIAKGNKISGGAVSVKPNKLLIPIIAVVAVVVIALVIVSSIMKRPDRRILKAFGNTLGAKSFSAKIKLYEEDYGDRDEIKIDTEVIGKLNMDGNFTLYAKIDEGRYEYAMAYMGDDKVYISDDGDYYMEEIEFKDGADEVDENLEEFFGMNSQELLETAAKMLQDFHANGEDADYIKDYKYRESKNRYEYEIDLFDLIDAFEDDYDGDIDRDIKEDLRDEARDFTVNLALELTENNKYLSKVDFELIWEDEDYSIGLSVSFDDYNKIKENNGKAKKLKDKYEKEEGGSGLTKSRLKTANSMAKTAYNAAAEYVAEKETQGISPATSIYEIGYTVIDCTGSVPNDDTAIIYDALAANGKDAGYVLIFSATINGYSDSLVVQWRSSLDSDVIGQYPEAITYDYAKEHTVYWGEFNPQ